MKKPFKCDLCEVTFSNSSNLKRHVVSVHDKKKSFECDICEVSFSHKSLLKKHVASVHEKNKQFKCEICEKPFSKKGLVKRHISSVHEERRAIKMNLQKKRLNQLFIFSLVLDFYSTILSSLFRKLLRFLHQSLPRVSCDTEDYILIVSI